MIRNVAKLKTLLLAIWLSAGQAFGAPELVRGMNVTELGDYRYDASTDPEQKTEAQKVVDRLHELGFRQITLSPRAWMYGPRVSELKPVTPPADRARERMAYLRLIRYAHSLGMKVGMRPLFFVVDSAGHTPVVEKLPDGTQKMWWHGNIQPEDPNKWFESFRTYLDLYLPIARAGKVEEFTLGAELYSMTVGIEDQWKKYPYGFPGQWLSLLEYTRGKLPEGCRIMYDINFTDDKIASPTLLEQFGGEFARWRYRIVDLAGKTDPKEKEAWEALVKFWKGLDGIGIDLYRSLATRTQVLPTDYEELVKLLTATADRYASQMDNALFEIESVVGAPKEIVLKEIGYRSVEKSFIDPFLYVGEAKGPLSLSHQAAAFEAIFRAFWKPNWPWFKGISLWDASLNPKLHGPLDTGFSPLGKPDAEKVLQHYFGED